MTQSDCRVSASTEKQIMTGGGEVGMETDGQTDERSNETEQGEGNS